MHYCSYTTTAFLANLPLFVSAAAMEVESLWLHQISLISDKGCKSSDFRLCLQNKTFEWKLSVVENKNLKKFEQCFLFHQCNNQNVLKQSRLQRSRVRCFAHTQLHFSS